MMQINIAYGREGLTVQMPDRANVSVVEPRFINGLEDPENAIIAGLKNPIGTRPLCDLVKPDDRVGIVFSDITRPTPNSLIIPLIIQELGSIPDNHIILFNGTGTHRQNTEAELEEMLGQGLVNRYTVIQNDSDDVDSHLCVGKTRSGNDIWIHKEFMECDVRILVGFIEPHFFAGFSGGPKAVMPGLALLETVLRNHSAEHMDHPRVRWGITYGNPLWEEILEGAAMTDPTFLVNVSLNNKKEITSVFAGDFEKAHAEGCRYVKQTVMTGFQKPFDIVISNNSGYPLDLNVYQSVKGMSAAAQIVREGGSIVMAADCWDGIPEHGDYGRLLLEMPTLDALLENVRRPELQVQDKWQAHIQALICKKADVYFYSHNLDAEKIRSCKLLPSLSVEDTINTLLEKYGPDASICVIPEGPQTIPYLIED